LAILRADAAAHSRGRGDEHAGASAVSSEYKHDVAHGEVRVRGQVAGSEPGWRMDRDVGRTRELFQLARRILEFERGSYTLVEARDCVVG
jgi:hypothetical protein